MWGRWSDAGREVTGGRRRVGLIDSCALARLVRSRRPASRLVMPIMKRLLTAALFAVHLPADAAEILPGPYEAEILRVIDGDTVEARVRIWLGLDQTIRIRLRGIDAPEIHGNCPGEREAAAASREHLSHLLLSKKIYLFEIGADKYGGRIDALLRLPDGADVSSLMVQSGHAQPIGRARIAHCPD